MHDAFKDGTHLWSQYSNTLHFLVISIGAFLRCIMVCGKMRRKGLLLFGFSSNISRSFLRSERFSPFGRAEISPKKHAVKFKFAVLDFAMNNGLSC